MNTLVETQAAKSSLSEAARERLLSFKGEPLFIADWERVLMIHYEVDEKALQDVVPFELDLLDGRAFVSVVAFTMRAMRPRVGGQVSVFLLKPIATHEFLNVRTYVRCRAERGIYFLAEWLANRLSVALGPWAFGLPYRHGRLSYKHSSEEHLLAGRVVGSKGRDVFAYEGTLPAGFKFTECKPGSLDEWLMERYTAFTFGALRARFFRVWHSTWQQTRADIVVLEHGLLRRAWPFFRDAQFINANFSPGVRDVWMGRPHRISKGSYAPAGPLSFFKSSSMN